MWETSWIYPNLGEPVRWSQEKALTFYVVVIPARGAVPRAMLEIVGGGRHLRRLRSTCLPLIRPAESHTSRKYRSTGGEGGVIRVRRESLIASNSHTTRVGGPGWAATLSAEMVRSGMVAACLG
jgi:hypothetical protein